MVTPGAASGAVAASELYKEIGANAEQWDIFRNSVALIESNGKYDIFGAVEIIMMEDIRWEELLR